MSDRAAPKKLLTLSSGGWVILLAVFFSLVAAGLVLYPVYETGGHRAIGDGQHIETYGFDLSNLTVPRERLAASGYPKDGIRAVPAALVETVSPPDVELIAQNEHIRFLVPHDEVIGVSLGGESRAYPVRIMNVHEVVNDVVGGTPIVVTWSPLCGSAVVFDRRIEGEQGAAVEFGVSGIVYESNLVLFDRRSEARRESLWPQLSWRAICGASVGKSLTLVTCEVTTWAEWLRAHPSTRAFLGLRTLKAEYNNAQDPFNLYLANDNLRFPVSRLWGRGGVAKKTPIVAESEDGRRWTAKRAGAATAPPPPYRIRSFVFAWYAQHSDDTDYSTIGP